MQRLREKRTKRPKGKKVDGRDTKNTDAVTRRRNGNGEKPEMVRDTGTLHRDFLCRNFGSLERKISNNFKRKNNEFFKWLQKVGSIFVGFLNF